LAKEVACVAAAAVAVVVEAAVEVAGKED